MKFYKDAFDGLYILVEGAEPNADWIEITEEEYQSSPNLPREQV